MFSEIHTVYTVMQHAVHLHKCSIFAEMLHFNCFCVFSGVQVAHAALILPLLKSLANAP